MNPSRRRFIRVLGSTGVILAAGGVGLARCDGMPAAAIEAWEGPGDEPDSRRWALAHAILAPNPHNMQPWLVDLSGPDRIDLYVDRTRLLPETDPFGRQILIGHGCFLELLALAAGARGLQADIDYFPDGPMGADGLTEQRVATVTLVPASTAPDPLHRHILARRSNKEPYDTERPVLPDHLAVLAAVTLPAGQILRLESAPDRVARLRELTAEAMRIEMATPRTLAESVDRTRIGAAEIAAHRDGIDLHGPFFWFARQAGLMTRDKAMTPGTLAHQGGLDYALGYMGSSMAFGWILADRADRVAEVDAGRAYVRLNLAATGVDLGMHPVSQLLQEYPEMAASQRTFLDFVGVPAEGRVQMLFRMGYAPSPDPSPRRPLADILRG
ncbi:MAG: nitroreductase family protein [Geminicoccaceae bacterium]